LEGTKGWEHGQKNEAATLKKKHGLLNAHKKRQLAEGDS